jgi:hypothetical protein
VHTQTVSCSCNGRNAQFSRTCNCEIVQYLVQKDTHECPKLTPNGFRLGCRFRVFRKPELNLNNSQTAAHAMPSYETTSSSRRQFFALHSQRACRSTCAITTDQGVIPLADTSTLRHCLLIAAKRAGPRGRGAENRVTQNMHALANVRTSCNTATASDTGRRKVRAGK